VCCKQACHSAVARLALRRRCAYGACKRAVAVQVLLCNFHNCHAARVLGLCAEVERQFSVRARMFWHAMGVFVYVFANCIQLEKKLQFAGEAALTALHGLRTIEEILVEHREQHNVQALG